ncbi:Pyridoxal phosphate-dependent enzyme domain containing protein [Trichostrongylus colubriformis]|uniref:Pyridoxal phosphate-dependent enzyme domain containing protein n=1 Tax=Trichostrongylus colubriformis TaxID=6319 RepID=A0AAN8FR70_TRICO
MITPFLYVFATLFTISQQEIGRPLPRLSRAPSDELTKDRAWTKLAIRRMWQERKKMSHTPLFKFNYIGQQNVDIIFKNESAARSGSLKHRYAWSLLMWALIEGHVKEGTAVYEASSGNTAASLAYMCRLLNVPFTAIVPDTIEDVKARHIEEYGADVVKVPLSQRLIRARELATQNGGFFMNQFGNADKAEEFHESGDFPLESANLFHEILVQLEADIRQDVKIPHYFVHSAGTGGTISSVGRYVKKYGINTEIVLADTQFSIYYDYVMYGRFKNESGANLWVEPGMAGIGYGPMGMARKGETTSMDAAVIDRVVKVPDIAATAAMRVLREQGASGGTSSGVNLLTSMHIAATAVKPKKSRLVIATLLADPGHYYDSTYYNREWIARKFARHGGLQAYDCWYTVITECLASGDDPLLSGYDRCPSGLIA